MLPSCYPTTTHLLTSDDDSCSSWESATYEDICLWNQVEDTQFQFTDDGDCYYDSSLDPDYCPSEDLVST